MKLRLYHWFLLVLIFTISFFGAVIFSAYNSPTILTFPFHAKNFIQLKDTQLLKGEKVGATFTASEKNLGIVGVRFQTFSRINNDIVVFRLKEEGASAWYYENQYKTDQFQPRDFFTFGFPIINDSLSKKYYFEIESVNGQDENAVAIDLKEPIFITKHQFSKQELLSNKGEIVTFLIKKIQNLFLDLQFLSNLLIFLLLPVLYVLGMLYRLGYIKKQSISSFANLSKEIVLTPGMLLYIFCLVLTTIITPAYNSFVVFLMVIYWLVLLKLETLEVRTSMEIAIFLLMLCVVAVIFQYDRWGENLAFWAYLLLVMGTIHSLIYYIKHRENK